MNSKTFVYKLIQFFNQCSPAGCLEAWPAVGSFDNVFFKEPRAAVGIWYALSNSNEGNRIWYTEWMELFGLRRNLLSSNVWWIKIKTLETFPYPPESLSYSASQPVPGPRNDNISHLFKLNKQPKEGRKEGRGGRERRGERKKEREKKEEKFLLCFLEKYQSLSQPETLVQILILSLPKSGILRQSAFWATDYSS